MLSGVYANHLLIVNSSMFRKFAVGIGEKLQELSISSPREKKAESKVVSVVSTATQEKKTLGKYVQQCQQYCQSCYCKQRRFLEVVAVCPFVQ